MIKKGNTLVTNTSAASHGGTGNIDRTPLLQPDEFYNKGRLLNHMHLAAGSSVGGHAHKDEQEIYYIISGKGTYDDNGTLVDIEAGDVTVCPPGSTHGIRADKGEDLNLIALILYAN
ncbi:MAG TPA: cupin domain-containing protein [Bellilinea sp.]|nr:cupin domain-containing protein [Bellilinea sp.]